MKQISETKIGEYQWFRPGKGTSDQIFVICQMMEKCNEHKIDLHTLFIDFRQAFDSIFRPKLKTALQDLEVPRKLINLVMMFVEGSNAQVKIDNKLSKPFTINKGVRQGEGLSTTLFVISLHRGIKPTLHHLQ